MIRSMTGFGRGESHDGCKEFRVEIKAVNHRYCDIFLKIPRQLSFMEDKIRELVVEALSRGKIDVYVTYENFEENSKCVLYDEALAKAYTEAMKCLRDKFNLQDDISVSVVSRFPEVLKIKKTEEDETKTWELLKNALEKAVNCLISMRESEGGKLRDNLETRACVIEDLLKEIEMQAGNVVKNYKQRLDNRLKELLDGQPVEENRFAMEVALFADRCSIDEEIVRLDSHINQLRQTLNMHQPVGRKLDFLIQEMNREINTIGSKANDLEITKRVVEIKSEIEKMREQVQNIE